jgi:hypothetical protein
MALTTTFDLKGKIASDSARASGIVHVCCPTLVIHTINLVLLLIPYKKGYHRRYINIRKSKDKSDVTTYIPFRYYPNSGLH